MRYWLRYTELNGLNPTPKTQWFNKPQERNKFVTHNGLKVISFGQTAVDLHETQWAKDFKEENRMEYEEAIELASMFDVFVRIFETEETGETVWAIESVDRPDFWFTARRTEEEAIQLCNEMGWTILYHRKREAQHA